MKTKRSWLCAAACAAACLVVVPSYGALIAPVLDDAFVYSNHPDGSFGDEGHLLTWTAYMAGQRGRSYIKFSLSGMPDLSMVASATLYLYQYDAGGFVDTVNIHHVADDWTQDTITWDTRPLPNPGDADRVAGNDIGYDAGWVSWDLLASGVWDYNSDLSNGYVSFLIKSSERGDERHIFYSSDAASLHPYIEIVVIPEPATVCLLGMGGLSVLKRRK